MRGRAGRGAPGGAARRPGRIQFLGIPQAPGPAAVLRGLDGTLTGRAIVAPLQHARQDRFAEAMRAALRPLYTESLGVRIVSEFGWVIGTVPSA